MSFTDDSEHIIYRPTTEKEHNYAAQERPNYCAISVLTIEVLFMFLAFEQYVGKKLILSYDML